MIFALFHRKLFWGIKVWQLLAFLSFYFFFAFLYWLTLWFTTGGRQNIWREALLDYFVLKALLTLPLWGLYFIVWKHKSLLTKIFMHLVTGPLWVSCWFYSYRLMQNWRGGRYLQGDGAWWDVYIPTLVYFLQFAVFHVYDFYQQNQKQKQKEKELLQVAHQSEVNALKAQIQPHFLFNTLNAISASVPAEMEHTRELIAKLADTFRYSLHASNKDWISLHEELDFTKITLDLEKERLRGRLIVVYDIDESLLHTKVPPMLLQPLTENTIRHGIGPSLTGGTVTIKIIREGASISIAVSDTGVGYKGTLNEEIFTKGIGLHNTNLRLEKLYGQKIKVEHNKPQGLKFSFIIPI